MKLSWANRDKSASHSLQLKDCMPSMRRYNYPSEAYMSEEQWPRRIS